MASPQTENGFIKIANELWNEILRRDFSKRQLKLILFIWRLSYGTGQKDCAVERFNQFEIAGIYKNDIKKELTFLRECSVLNWDEKEMIFSINKNYKLWQITPSKNWDIEKFNSLIHLNLNRKKVSKTLTHKKEAVSKTLTFKSGIVSNSLTMKLVKYQQRDNSIIAVAGDSSSLKTVLKTLKIKDIKRIEENRSTEDPFHLYEENIGLLSPLNRDSLIAWCEDLGDELVVAAIKLAVKYEARTYKYFEDILKEWAKAGLKSVEDARAYVVRRENLRKKTIPFRNSKQRKEEAQSLLDKYREV